MRDGKITLHIEGMDEIKSLMEEISGYQSKMLRAIRRVEEVRCQMEMTLNRTNEDDS